MCMGYNVLYSIYIYNIYVYKLYVMQCTMRMQGVNPCPALGDDRHILVILLILGGDDVRFLISGSCFAHRHSFSPDFFLMTFFLLVQLFFTHFL